MAENKFNDRDFLINLKGVLTQMKGGLATEIEKRVDRLKNIHEEYKDIIVHAEEWHKQEKERAAEKDQKQKERSEKYADAERLAKEYGG